LVFIGLAQIKVESILQFFATFCFLKMRPQEAFLKGYKNGKKQKILERKAGLAFKKY
jgi:hypothetical protein